MGTRTSVAHDSAVAALLASYAAVDPATSVRLGKSTSNLFRFPDRTSGRRLDVSAFDHVLSVDPVNRTADVQGMTTYEHLVDATLPYGLMPLVVPQLKTITLGGAVTGLGIESTSFRNGLPHESVLEMDVLTGDGRVVVATAGQRARRPVPRLPQLVRHARLRAAAADRARAGTPVRAAAAPAVRHRPTTASPRWRRSAPSRAYRRRAGRLRRRHRVQPRTSSTSPWARSSTTRAGGERLHRQGRSTTGRSSAAPATSSPCTTTCGAGTPTGSGARGRSACSTRRCAGCGRGGTGAPTSTGGWSRSTGGTGSPRRIDRAARPAAAGGGRPGRRDPGRRAGEVPRRLPPRGRASRRSGCARCGCATTQPGRCTRWTRASSTSTSASGRAVAAARPASPDGDHNRLIEETVAALGGHKSLYSHRVLRREEFWRRYNGAPYTRAEEDATTRTVGCPISTTKSWPRMERSRTCDVPRRSRTVLASRDSR